MFTVFLWVLAGIFFAGGFGYPYPANVMPLMFGGTALALLTGRLVVELRALAARRGIQALDDSAAAETARRSARGSEALGLAWVVGVMAVLLLLGFVVGMTLVLVGLIRFYLREGWVMSVAIPLGVVAVLYLAFGILLGVPLYPGFVRT